jgi:hypothetical protein
VHFAMLAPACGNGELIAHLPAQRMSLHEAQMMGGRSGHARRLDIVPRHEPNMLPVANALRFRERGRRLVNGK